MAVAPWMARDFRTSVFPCSTGCRQESPRCYKTRAIPEQSGVLHDAEAEVVVEVHSRIEIELTLWCQNSFFLGVTGQRVRDDAGGLNGRGRCQTGVRAHCKHGAEKNFKSYRGLICSLILHNFINYS